MKKYRLLVLAAILIFANNLRADDLVLATITIKEDSGFPRNLEYEVKVQYQ
jgi:hypothetical protein